MAQPDLFMPRHRVVAKVSGGVGSYSATRRYVDQHGATKLTLLFTDTLCEDQDAYRFLIAGAANLFDIALPVGFVPAIDEFPAWEDRAAYKAFVLDLADRSMAAIPGLDWLSDGRDPWDVYEDERFLGNSLADPCSKVLKRQVADRWLAGNVDQMTSKIIVGLDFEEVERFEGDGAKRRGLRAIARDAGWTFIAPLCDAPLISWGQRVARLDVEGLWLPRLNALGFAHNNCGDHCCKAGQGHWRLMLRHFPERYAYVEWREQKIRELLGDVSMLTDRRGGGIKRPLTLRMLRTRELEPVEASDMGGCNCYFGEAA